ncbi:hypothetical protein NC652_003705 [Populus alba x Populus x berolinensis]|nr:hypothetical protein NC652_003705 [Populus alba x Populus x berolinensis]
MEDSEGVLSFDFEGGLDSGPANPIASIPAIPSDNYGAATAAAPNTTNTTTNTTNNSNSGAADIQAGRRSFRQTVCRHWLRSLCMKGDACGFLHQYDKSRMPVCRFFRLYGECREQDCVYKHTNEDIKECNMYKLGFCPNGPDCRYRHAKLPGPPPPVEEVVQKIQQLNSYNSVTSNKNFQQRNAGFSQQIEKSPNTIIKPSGTESANVQQQQQTQTPHLTNGQHQQPQQPNPLNRIATPLPQGISRLLREEVATRDHSSFASNDTIRFLREFDECMRKSLKMGFEKKGGFINANTLGIPRIAKLEIEGSGFHTNLYAVRGVYSGGKEGKSRIQWLRSMVGSPDLISIPGEVGRMYEANVDDVGYRLVAIYTPVREDGVEGQPVSASTEATAVEPDVLKEVKQKLELGSVKFEILREGSLERRILEVNRKRVKVVKPGSKTSFPTTEIRGSYAPPFHVDLFRSDQHRVRIVVDGENEVDLMVNSRHLRDVIVLVIRGFAQRFNSTSLNSLLKIET